MNLIVEHNNNTPYDCSITPYDLYVSADLHPAGIAHELGHKALGHLELPVPLLTVYERFLCECQAWCWAILRGAPVTKDIIEDCLGSYCDTVCARLAETVEHRERLEKVYIYYNRILNAIREVQFTETCNP
jgi:hypothetical protein